MVKFRYLGKIYTLANWWPENIGHNRVCVNIIDENKELTTLHIPSFEETFPNHNIKILKESRDQQHYINSMNQSKTRWLE